MIRTKVEKFEPFGRSYINLHPSADDTVKEIRKEVVILKPDTKSNDILHEIYGSKSVVILSQGSNKEEKRIGTKSYTVDNDIKGIILCQFENLTGLPNDQSGDSICVLGPNCVDIFGTDGSMFASPLPFKAEKVWPLPHGFCVQRMLHQSETNSSKKGVPVLFSLIHPLDDFCPIVYRYPENKKSFYFTDADQHIVFTSSKIPLLITYDTAVGIHIVWKVRKANQQDKPDPVTMNESVTDFQPAFQPEHISSRLPSRLSGTPNINGRHFYTPSPAIARSRSHTPARMGASPASFARINSPLFNTQGQVSRIASPHSAIMHEASFPSSEIFSNLTQTRGFGSLSSPLIYRLPSEDYASIHEEFELDSMPPTICLEHIWQEDEVAARDGRDGKEDKVFMTEDSCGRNFLCILLNGLNTLRLIEMETNIVTSSYCFDVHANIPAKAAGPLEKLKMMVVFDPSGDLILYSGSIKICCLDSLMRIQQLSMQEKSASALQLLQSSYTTEAAETPRNRSSSKAEIGDNIRTNIISLRDFTGDGFSLMLSDGKLFRVKVPELTSDELVLKCVDVVKSCLENDATINIIARFYSFLNESLVDDGLMEHSDWKKFMDVTLMLMGYPERLRKTVLSDEGNSPSPPQPKRAKKSDSFCENANDDWEYLLDSDCSMEWKEVFKTGPKTEDISISTEAKEEISLNSNTPLYHLIATLFQRWHLLYQDLKLNVLARNRRKNLVTLLIFLARSLQLETYCMHYISDYPELSCIGSCNFFIPKDQLEDLHVHETKFLLPLNIEEHLIQEISLGKAPFEFLSPFKTSQLVLKTIHCITNFTTMGMTASPDSMISELQISDPERSIKQDCTEKLLEIFSAADFSRSDLERLPFGLALIYQELLHHYRHKAPCHLPSSSAMLLGREDLAAQTDLSVCHNSNEIQPKGPRDRMEIKFSEEELFKIRFNCDLRIEEVKRLLDSSTPVVISIVQKPEVSDHDFIKEQESKLLLFSKRTMALPTARGMFTLGTHTPMIGETIEIPTLELTGKATQSNKVISLSSQTDLPADHLQWPSFHNGVATGLQISHGSSQIDSTWIVYNKLKHKELTEELAGFMMALGLTGHLHVLPAHLIHDYLAKGREFTSIALLLGIAASKCSSKDADVYRLLAVHVDALLPPTALEISIPHSAQVAAILGTGLLYMETMERHLVKIFLQEISRPPGPEMENAVNRESHSLAAGFALGFVLLAKGADSLYLSDLKIAEELHHLVFGGQQCDLPTYLRDVFKSPSYLIKEGDTLNTDVTCPSAIIALSLIYLKTSNRVVANWFSAPETAATLDTIKPDNLLLMLLARGLILWDETVPSIQWVESHLPEIFRDISFDAKKESAYDVDAEALRLGYCCIIAGCCLAMGIKFAGSSNKAAFDTLLHFTKKFKKLVSNSLFEQGGKAVVEMCLVTALVSLSVVMAGSGNLQVLRIARSLRKRVNSDISYGAHVAVHMAIGFLFLGGGRYTLATNNRAVAGLLCAIYPKFPLNSRDNRYHLQAFRHLYVIACEPRLVIPRDIDSGNICYVPLQVILKETPSYPSSSIKLLAPCFIPELALISEVQVTGPRYWPITIKFDEGEQAMDEVIKLIGCLFVKKKGGYLSYSDDPKGHRNVMARTFTNQSEKLETIRSFSSNPEAILLGELFCSHENEIDEINSEFWSNILFECVSNEKLDMLPTYIEIEKVLTKASNGNFCPGSITQLKLLFHFYNVLFPKLQLLEIVSKPLINENYLIQSQLRLEKAFDSRKSAGTEQEGISTELKSR